MSTFWVWVLCIIAAIAWFGIVIPMGIKEMKLLWDGDDRADINVNGKPKSWN